MSLEIIEQEIAQIKEGLGEIKSDLDKVDKVLKVHEYFLKASLVNMGTIAYVLIGDKYR